MATDETRDTRERLLDEGECLFGQRGIAEVSLREITSAADANIASVNYHFGSKDGLVREVFARRMGPLNEERLNLLDELEAAAGEEPQALEQLPRIFAGPTIRMARRHPDFMMLAGRYHLDQRADCIEVMHAPRFHEFVQRIRSVLVRKYPHVAESTLWWAMHFVVGMMLHTWMGGKETERLSGGVARWEDDEVMIDRLVHFATAGFAHLVELES